MRFIRKSDCWCATVLKLNFILYINTKRPCKAIWLLFWLILFCFVSFCFFLHFCSVIFLFRSVPVGESSFSLSLQNIVSVRLGSSPWMVGGIHHWNHLCPEVFFGGRGGVSVRVQPEKQNQMYIKRFMARHWWLERHKRGCPQEGQAWTLGHRLELLSTDRISSSSERLNSALQSFGPIESCHSDYLG